VDSALFSPPATGVLREPRVLYVGRVERTSRWKGLQVLLESMVRLRELVPGVRLEVVGEGDDVLPLQKRAAELGVADLVDWAGRVPHGDLPSYYRRAGVTVLPSLTESESFGIALVEAMASGCPVVGSDVGGIPFVVRDGVDGVLVPPGDIRALAEALSGVLTDPPRAGLMGAAGRDAALSRWDWARQRTNTLRLIEGVAR
jgi:glycosyltransferase involved in cell wall biosynthesis